MSEKDAVRLSYSALLALRDGIKQQDPSGVILNFSVQTFVQNHVRRNQYLVYLKHRNVRYETVLDEETADYTSFETNEKSQCHELQAEAVLSVSGTVSIGSFSSVAPVSGTVGLYSGTGPIKSEVFSLAPTMADPFNSGEATIVQPVRLFLDSGQREWMDTIVQELRKIRFLLEEMTDTEIRNEDIKP